MGFWLQEVTNAVSGNFDRLGGVLVGHGIINFPRLVKKQGAFIDDDRLCIDAFLSVGYCFHGGVLAEDIMTPYRRQMLSLFGTEGNCINTMANFKGSRRSFKHSISLYRLTYPSMRPLPWRIMYCQ